MKKASAILVTLVVFLFFGVTVYAASLGDVNNDGDVNAADARLALRTATGLEPEIVPGTDAYEVADVDFNGIVTAADARIILRAIVGIEPLPGYEEPEPPFEKELREKLSAAILDVDVYTTPGHGNYGFGFAIDENGTFVVPYDLIYKATNMYILGGMGYTIESVLAVDHATGLALLRVSGNVPYLPVSSTDLNEGDEVYTTDYLHSLHRMAVTDLDSGAFPDMTEHAICAELNNPRHWCDMKYYPMVDSSGSVVGIIMEENYANGKTTVNAIPISALPSPEQYNPRDLETFILDEWRVRMDFPEESFFLVQYGTGIFPLSIDNRMHPHKVELINPRRDCLDVKISRTGHDFISWIMEVIAKQPCENVPITIRSQGLYETTEHTVYISVLEEGGVGMVGVAHLPDPGVIWKMTPTEILSDDFLRITYRKSDTDLTSEELFFSYIEMLGAYGYEYVSESWGGGGHGYYFQLKKYGVTVAYYDAEDTVTIRYSYE